MVEPRPSSVRASPCLHRRHGRYRLLDEQAAPGRAGAGRRPDAHSGQRGGEQAAIREGAVEGARGGSRQRRQAGALAVVRGRRTLPERLALFVYLEPRLLEVLHDALGEHLARIVQRRQALIVFKPSSLSS
jgi:hypothetical protein